MSAVRKFHVPNRLKQLMRRPGGDPAQVCIDRAEAGVETLREEGLKTVAATLAEIEQRFGLKSDRTTADFEVLYTLLLRLIDVSGFVTHLGLDRAAVSLCSLIDGCAEAGRWRWAAVDVHLDALRLLWNAGETLSEEERLTVLEGLYKVSKHQPDE